MVSGIRSFFNIDFFEKIDLRTSNIRGGTWEGFTPLIRMGLRLEAPPKVLCIVQFQSQNTLKVQNQFEDNKFSILPLKKWKRSKPKKNSKFLAQFIKIF